MLLIVLLHLYRITQIPQGISALRKLEILDLSHNEISSIPPDMGELCALLELDLSHNHIMQIAEVASKWKTLLKLFVVSFW